MRKFEYGLAGVMAFLILSILGMIVVSSDSSTIEIKENMRNSDSASTPKSSASITLGAEPIDPEPKVTIGEPGAGDGFE